MTYRHHTHQAQPIDLPTGKAVCVGRNYLDHIQELNNDVPTEALLFIKPATAMCDMHQAVAIPTHLGECHNELELALLIQSPLTKASAEDALNAVWGVGMALDLTLRDVQSQLKAKGHPWERAKAFDRSCPTSGFIPLSEVEDITNIDFTLSVNGKIQQQGNSQLMIRNMVSLLVEISEQFTLMPGDIVLTGTPKGVGPLQVGDELTATLSDKMSVCTNVVEAL